MKDPRLGKTEIAEILGREIAAYALDAELLQPSNPAVGSHDPRDGLAPLPNLAHEPRAHISAPKDDLLAH
jgi:hypothetical protein